MSILLEVSELEIVKRTTRSEELKELRLTSLYLDLKSVCEPLTARKARPCKDSTYPSDRVS